MGNSGLDPLTKMHLCANITYVTTPRKKNSSKASPTLKAQGQQPAGLPVGEMPKSVVEAWLLLLLKTWGAHGYALVELLKGVGFTNIDHTRIYRELRGLEKRGLVTSAWDVSSNGPAKRLYTITAAGEEFLSGCAQLLQGYTRVLEAFGTLYSGGFKTLLDFQTGRITEREKKGGDDGGN
jgi:poly-beta-hydroxybutyrate-responsive repressor